MKRLREEFEYKGGYSSENRAKGQSKKQERKDEKMKESAKDVQTPSDESILKK